MIATFHLRGAEHVVQVDGERLVSWRVSGVEQLMGASIPLRVFIHGYVAPLVWCNVELLHEYEVWLWRGRAPDGTWWMLPARTPAELGPQLLALLERFYGAVLTDS